VWRRERGIVRRALLPREDGFGLVEVIVAIFILGLLAVALLPLLIQGMTVAAAQSTTATANRMLSSTIDTARSNPAAQCDELAVDDLFTDARGVELRAVGRAVDATGAPLNCATFSPPGTVRYLATVSDGERELVRATTLIFIPEPPAAS